MRHSPTTSTRPQALAALRDIAQAISTAWDLDTTLDLIARKTTEVMHVDSCTIYLLDPDGQTLRLRATTGLARRSLGRATLKVGEGMTGHAVKRNRPVYASNAHDDPHFTWVDGTDEMAFQSLAAVPLVIESEVIGALNVQTKSAHDYSGDEIQTLSLIADLAAGALAKARLYDSQKRQIKELQALAEISEVVTSPQYLNDILDVVTGMAAKIMNAAVCSIFLVDETGQYLRLRSAKRATNPYQRRPPLTVGEGVIGQVVTSGRSIYVADVRSDPRYVGKELAKSEGLVSLLSVPLSVRQRVIGVFNCYTSKEHYFSKEQQALFLTLANQTALAIENAQLVTNAAIVREMHHRIKNNLQTIAMLMRLQLSEASEEARRELTTSIHRVHSIAVVHEILSERGFRSVDLKDVLERISVTMIESMTAPDQIIKVRVMGESIALPTRAASHLALVVNELVQNALDHAFASQRTGEITISLGQAPEEIVIVVRDNGIGLSNDRDPGLGLEIVQFLVYDELRGSMSIKGDQPGTEVTIRVPRSIETAENRD